MPQLPAYNALNIFALEAFLFKLFFEGLRVVSPEPMGASVLILQGPACRLDVLLIYAVSLLAVFFPVHTL
jgi:hypothetical protein